MRKLFVIAVFAAVTAGSAAPVMANYFWPGRVVIGYGGGGGTTNANTMGPGDCVIPMEIQCECFTGMTVYQACMKSASPLYCLTPGSSYVEVEQGDPPVLLKSGASTLGDLVCSGASTETAYVVLPTPGMIEGGGENLPEP